MFDRADRRRGNRTSFPASSRTSAAQKGLPEELRPHDMRQGVETLASEAGVELHDISKAPGHAAVSFSDRLDVHSGGHRPRPTGSILPGRHVPPGREG